MASYPPLVHRLVLLLYASFGPASRLQPLRFATLHLHLVGRGLSPPSCRTCSAHIGIGGVVTHAPLPHHRTCGSRIRRFGGLSRASQKDGKDPASQNAHWEGQPGEPSSVREARGHASWKPFSRKPP